MSRCPMSKEHPEEESVGWPLGSTPTSTLTVRDTLDTETSQLPESEMCGLRTCVCVCVYACVCVCVCVCVWCACVSVCV